MESNNDKTIKLRGDICHSWGFGSKSNQMKGFITYLQNKGIKVEFTVNPLQNGNNEFYLIQILEDGSENVVFTNKKTIHPKAANGYFSSDLYSEIESKIIMWRNRTIF